MIDIQKLSRKRKPSGKNVAQAIFITTLNKDASKLFTQQKIDKMFSKLTQEDYNEYELYKTLFNKMLQFQAEGEAYRQQAFSGIAIIESVLNELKIYLMARKALERVPVIMTERQYEEHKRLVKERSRQETISYANVIYFAIDWMREYEDIPEELSRSVNTLKTEVLKDEALLKEISRMNDIGSFICKDGSREDEMSQNEFCEKVTDFYIAEKGGIENAFDDEFFPRAALTKRKARLNILAVLDIADEYNFDYDYKLHKLGEVTKYDAIFGDISLMGEPFKHTEKCEKLLNLFISNFGNFFHDLCDYLSKKFGLSYLQEVKDASDLFKDITLGELSDANFLDTRDRCESMEDFCNVVKDLYDVHGEDTERILYGQEMQNGIAIIQEDRGRYTRDNGHFSSEYISFLDDTMKSVTQVFHDKEKRNTLKEAYDELVIGGICRMYMYNATFELMAEITEVDDIKKLQYDLSAFQERLTKIDDTVKELKDIASENYVFGGWKDSAMLDVLFPRVSVDWLKPTEEALRNFKQIMGSADAFASNIRFRSACNELLRK